ncbi:hypothetical protein J3T65_01015, partial [Staphylococcus simiae]
RELGFVLMAVNIRKLAAQGAVYFKINNEKDNFYQFSIEIVFFTFTKNLMSQALREWDRNNCFITNYFVIPPRQD